MNSRVTFVIVVGMPCSGKTTYCKNEIFEDYKLYDDFIPSFYDGKIIKDLKIKKK